MAVTDMAFEGIARILARVSGQEMGARRLRLGETVLREVVLVDRPAVEIYGFWLDVENLPRIVPGVERVRSLGDGRSSWSLKGDRPGSQSHEVEVRLREEVPGERITWSTLPGAEVEHNGSVTLEPGPRGTGVSVEVRYAVGGPSAVEVLALVGVRPESTLREGLRRFKRRMETGECVTTVGQPRGTCGGRSATRK